MWEVMLLKNVFRRSFLALLCCALLLAAPPVDAAAADEGIDFLSYEEALTYFDFDKAAYNWCVNFGLDPSTRLLEARHDILAGTDPELIIRLATFSRDTGHGNEPLVVSNAFRPACYQEVIGLHDSNTNTGLYRNAMSWNGRSVTGFWWTAESAPGWPESCSIDLSEFDLDTLDLRYYYRAALRLWDNGWVGNYYAKPGCSAHNSGTAIDITNYWLGANFATAYEYNGKTYSMADYGLYKPLQPSATSAGETWHITSTPAVLALGNYDAALNSGFEVVYALYYNPVSRGWNMSDGRGLYLGAGVTVLQIRLCQLGLLEEKYITGFFCSKTDEAVRAFQARQGLEPDGICGAGTMEQLLGRSAPAADAIAPDLSAAVVTEAGSRGFKLYVSGGDEQRLNAFRVDTRLPGEEQWVTRYYNAPATGQGVLDIDIWQEGLYEVRAAARDAAGNESELLAVGSVFVDTTPPQLRSVRLWDITEDGFTVTAQMADNGTLSGFRVLAESDTGARREDFCFSNGVGVWRMEGLDEGVWTVTVTAVDSANNERGYTFAWRFVSGQAQPGRSVTHYG